jgi:O-antigen ligase
MTRPDDKLAAERPRRPLVILSPRHLVTGGLAGLLVAAFALLPLPIGLLSLLAPLALCLLFVDPVVSLYIAILSVPIQDIVLLPGGVSLTQAAMALVVFHTALDLLARPGRHIRVGRLFPLWLAFLWALALSSSFTSYSAIEGVKETLRWFEAFVIWLLAVNLARRRWQALGLIACILLAPASEAVYGLVQFALGIGPPSFRIAPGLPFVRAYGTIGQPNSFAGYLNMAWPLALALAAGFTWQVVSRVWHGKHATTRGASQATPTDVSQSAIYNLQSAILLWFLALLLLAGLLASFSRGAWLGAAIGMFSMALALGGRARWWALVALALGALALALGGVGALPPFIATRLASITRYVSLFDAGAVVITPDNFAVVERMSQMQAGARMFLAYPLSGVGPGNYSLAYPTFAVGQWYVSRGHAHNYYLHIAAETGIVGAIAYLALLVGLVRQASITLRRSTDIVWRSVAIGCCGIIAAAMGHDLFENVHVLSMGIQLASVWGLLTVVEDLEKRPQYPMRPDPPYED